ncbi:MAG: hypothetical protein ACE1S7_06535 [Candidatus Tisiphia sp.]
MTNIKNILINIVIIHQNIYWVISIVPWVKKITKTKYYQILYYKTLASQDCIISKKRIFLVIPSIFNSPEILFLAKSKSFVDNLRHCGEVFLVDWFEVDEADYLLEDYVKRVVKIISNLRQKSIK